MKKLLVAALALTTVSAFAGGLVELTHDGGNNNFNNLNFNMMSDDTDGAEQSDLSFALNYTHDFNGQFMAGLTYISKKETTDGDVDAGSMTTTGVHFFYNLSGKVLGSYAGLRYHMHAYADDAGSTAGFGNDGDAQTDIILEYGHRFGLGKLAGVHWAWVPTISYAMSTSNEENADVDVKTTTLTWTPVNFNVIF